MVNSFISVFNKSQQTLETKHKLTLETKHKFQINDTNFLKHINETQYKINPYVDDHEYLKSLEFFVAKNENINGNEDGQVKKFIKNKLFGTQDLADMVEFNNQFQNFKE